MFFLHFLAAFILPWTPASGQALVGTSGEYCNERFDFCLTYPDDYFTEKILADNGDGLHLAAQEGRVEVEVMGSYNVLGWSVTEIIDSYFQTLQEKPMEVQLLEIHTDEAYGWARMRYNYELQLFQVRLVDNGAYITTIITVPASDPALIDELNQSVRLVFPS